MTMTIAQFEEWSLIICLSGLMLYMFFIIWELAHKSKAGKYGYIALFLVLGLGMGGFVIKTVITYMLKV